MKLAICAVFKNEGPFLPEWIAYHRCIGVDDFVLYDNGSTDDGASTVLATDLADFVRIIQWPRRPAQLSAYRHFIYNFAEDYDWVIFIDLDEFLLPTETDDLKSLILKYNHYAGVLIHWRVFGPSGWEKRPPGLVIENFIWRAADTLPVNRHVKSIVRSQALLDISQNPHEFQVTGPVCNTNGQMVPMTGIQSDHCHEHLVLNHYITRSRADWMAKISRGNAMFDTAEPPYQIDLIEHFAEVSTVYDRTITRFAPKVAANCGSATLRHGQSIQQDSTLTVIGHIQNVGDTSASNGEWLGKRRSGRWIEGICLITDDSIPPDTLFIRAKTENGSWTPWISASNYVGTRGISSPLLGIAIRGGRDVHVRYQATFVGGSTSGPVSDGNPCESVTALEAVHITVTRRPADAPNRQKT